jgi:hypothetical protein
MIPGAIKMDELSKPPWPPCRLFSRERGSAQAVLIALDRRELIGQ